MVANISEWWRSFKQNWIILIILMYQNSNKNLLFKALASFSTPHFTKTPRITSGRQNRAQVWSWNLMLWKEIEQINSEHFKAELNWICLIGISVFLVVSDDLNWCRFSLKNYLTTRNLGARWAPISSWWPSATLLALRACLTLSFTPFGRSSCVLLHVKGGG